MPKKILLVDDDPTLSDMYSERLKASDYEVTVAHDGKAGLAAAQTEKPDVILLDIMMPEMNGLDVAKAIREDEKLADTPIIFLTALLKEAERAKEFMGEKGDYCVKPNTSPGELVAKIEKALS